MRNIAIAFLIMLFCLDLGAQQLIPEDDLYGYPEITPSDLKTMDPDSVVAFYYWGDNYGGDAIDTVLDVDALLKCRYLQKLTLMSIGSDAMQTILDNLDKFPLMQQLELRGLNLSEFPANIYKLKELKTLNLSYIDNFTPDSAALVDSKIRALEFDNVNCPCDEENLCEMRFDFFPKLTSLTVKNSNLNVLQSISRCHELVMLELQALEAGALDIDFSGLPELEYLRLADLYEVYDAPTGLENLKALTDLTVEGCNFDISSSGLEGCTGLERLDLKGIHMNDLSFLGSLTALTNLNLSSSELESLPNEISNCKKLIELNLAYNKLGSLPAGIFQLTALKFLDLTNNAITVIPKGLSNLKALNSLYLSYNPIKQIENGAFELPALTTLQMNHCPIYSLPDEIGNLTGLSILSLYDDSLTSIPATLFHLNKLEYLDISQNQLANLPSGWMALQELNYLNLGNNYLSKLPADLFKLGSLKNLNLENNKFGSLPKGISGMGSLSSLNLSHNPHIKLPKSMNKMTSLLYVFMRRPDLTEKEITAYTKLLGERLQLSDY